MPVPTSNSRSWWSDWGQTNDVEECIDPSPVEPIIPPTPPTVISGFQPLIEDFLIFETNKIDIYFIA
jgi:hypothetical protein